MKSVLKAIGTALELCGWLVVSTIYLIHTTELWARDELEDLGIASGLQAGLMFVLGIILIAVSARLLDGVYRYIAVSIIILIAGHFVVTTVHI